MPLTRTSALNLNPPPVSPPPLLSNFLPATPEKVRHAKVRHALFIKFQLSA